VTFTAYRYISEGNAFFPALTKYHHQQQQQQQQPSPYAQTVQEAVAGELPSGVSIAVADTRVDDIKVGGGEGGGGMYLVRNCECRLIVCLLLIASAAGVPRCFGARIWFGSVCWQLQFGDVCHPTPNFITGFAS
jgi:hypothetical protein